MARLVNNRIQPNLTKIRHSTKTLPNEEQIMIYEKPTCVRVEEVPASEEVVASNIIIIIIFVVTCTPAN